MGTGIAFVDRLTQRKADTPPLEPLAGQWQVLVESGEAATLGSVAVRNGDYLMPDHHGRYALNSSDNRSVATATFACASLPKQREQGGLIALARRLRLKASWSTWASVSPLAPGISDRAKVQDLDTVIEKYLRHLQSVCNQPRAHLKREEEPVALSRSRRISLRAPAYLAAHTEDWQYRGLRSVSPKRILSAMAEDEVNIYENQVAARLVDHLDRYLRDRIEEVGKIQTILEKADVTLEGATHWLRARLSRLLGEAMSSDVGRSLVADTLQTLSRLHRQVLQLRGSALYKAIPRQVNVQPELKATNIFTNDERYRYVALLWRKWRAGTTRRDIPPEESYRENQQLCKAFNLFCGLLAIRALQQLRYEPAADESVAPGSTIRLSSHTAGEELRLKWQTTGCIDISQASRPEEVSIRLIPLVAALTAAEDEGAVPDADAVRSRLDALQRAVGAAPLPSRDGRGHRRKEPALKVVIYPGDQLERLMLPSELQTRVHSLGNDLSTPTRVGILPVSCWEVDSVDRVARALRWALLVPQILSYPPEVEIPSARLAPVLEGVEWLRVTRDRRRAQLVLKPADEVVSAITTRLSDERLRLSRALGKTARQDIDWLEAMQHGLRQALDDLTALLRCPVCDKLADPRSFTSSDGVHFVCSCPSCHSTWGTRACECQARFAFLAPSGVPQPVGPREPGWVDDVLGCDVLAVPCWLPDAGSAYICPVCGHCGGASHDQGGRCARCPRHESG